MHETQSYKSYNASPYRSIKHTTYFPVYDQLFGGYRGKDITFVEIGILGGGSLFMWRDFFGPKARIIGVDLNPNAKKWEKDGFEIFIGSQSDEAFWARFKAEIGPVDIVLDDGGHTYEQQIITTESLLNMIKDGGLLVVEDTHTSFMAGFGPPRYSFMEYVKRMTDRISQRFSAFDHSTAEKRVWSVEVFESIVAFKVNRPASLLRSEATSNDGVDDQAEDFRYHDPSRFTRILRKFRILKTLPVIAPVARYLHHLVLVQRFRAKRFFR